MHILLYRHVYICEYMSRIRKTYNITLPDDVEEWLAKMVNNRTFANRSHGIEVAVRRMMNEENGQEMKTKQK